MSKTEKAGDVLSIVNRVERLTLTAGNIIKRMTALQSELERLQKDIYQLKEEVK